jgi:phage shock protein PspC (stress-responsive transcriptional regulator)
MHRVFDISLIGHAEPFRLHDDAYELLRGYLDSARARLSDDPDQAEVIGDLERSIGEKLAPRLGADKRVIDLDDVTAVLQEVGAVDTGTTETAAAVGQRPRRRRMYRIREGQEWAGVCTGLAAYAELEPNQVRWIFVGLGLVTVGLFLLVYLAAVFILPVASTREEYFAAMRARDQEAR